MTQRKHLTALTTTAVFAALLASGLWAANVRQISVDSSRDPRYLEFYLDTIQPFPIFNPAIGRSSPVKVARAAASQTDTMLLVFVNDRIDAGSSSGVGFVPFPGSTALTEKPLYLQMGDYLAVRDREGASLVAVGAGIRSDGVFAYRVSVSSEAPQTRALCALDELNGLDGWNGSLNALYQGDYDFDGKSEVLLFVNGGRDGPRRLYCLEVASLAIEWALTLSSPIIGGYIYDCHDQSAPGFVFSTYANANGFSDSVFSDSHSYVARVNRQGEVVFKYVIGDFAESCALIPGNNDSTFYLRCFDYSVNEAGGQFATPRQVRLARIDRWGRILDIYEEPGIGGRSLWTGDFDRDGRLDVYSNDDQGRVSIFDERLRLQARSARSNLHDWRGSIDNWPHEGRVFCITEAGGIGYYTQDLRKIAFASGEYLQTALDDAAGSTMQLLLTDQYGATLAEIRRKKLVDYIGIIYHDYQPYILAGMVGLALMAVMLNQNRRRARTDLNVISKQKAELERAYKKLEEATEAITRERAKAAAAEQYRVASGQFRHEINNALGAAKMYLVGVVGKAGGGGLKRRLEESHAALTNRVTKLLESATAATATESDAILAALKSEKEQVTRLIGELEDVVMKGIDRGLGLTERLRRYERIDHDDVFRDVDLVTAVREVVADRSTVLEVKKIAVKIAADSQVRFKCSPELMEVLFRNLLDNSIDACSEDKKGKHQVTIRFEQDDKRIAISWHDTGVGIKAESQGRIFQPFYTEKPSTGSGLGLSMVQSIVEKYGGTIVVDSQFGQYTQFDIEFKK